jgi:CubicO group peptidase (beta-lactamase class C family)
VPDRASRGGPDLAVTDHLSGNAADDRTFDAPLRFSGSRERKQRDDDGSANKQLLHDCSSTQARVNGRHVLRFHASRRVHAARAVARRAPLRNDGAPAARFMVRQGLAGVPGSPGEFMWAGYAGTFFWVDPKEELVAIVMAQTPGPVRAYYRRLVKQLVYQAIVDDPASPDRATPQRRSELRAQ